MMAIAKDLTSLHMIKTSDGMLNCQAIVFGLACLDFLGQANSYTLSLPPNLHLEFCPLFR